MGALGLRMAILAAQGECALDTLGRRRDQGRGRTHQHVAGGHRPGKDGLERHKLIQAGGQPVHFPIPRHQLAHRVPDPGPACPKSALKFPAFGCKTAPDSRLAGKGPPPYHPPLLKSRNGLMIQWMHTFSKHWIVTLMMGALTLAFVVWGMGLEQFNIGGGNSVASVGGTEIGTVEFERTYRNFLRNQSQRMGSEITPDMAEKMGLSQVALQQMIGRAALNNEAGKLGLTTSDPTLVQSVHGMEPFRGTLGQFDRQVFNQAIGQAGYTEDQFLGEVRQD